MSAVSFVCRVGQETAEGTQALLSPHVGRFRPHERFINPQRSALCMAGDEVGTLEVLGARRPLLCPPTFPPSQLTLLQRGVVSAAWGTTLLSVQPLKSAEESSAEGEASVGERAEGYPLEAPIDGTVYYSPSPDAPPFVEEGAQIEPGQVIALIEVMKFFYEIKHEGAQPVRALKRGVAHASPIEAGGALWYVTQP